MLSVQNAEIRIKFQFSTAPADPSFMGLDLLKYLKIMSEKKASDLHLKAGAPPILRVNRQLVLAGKDAPFLTHKEIQEAVLPLLSPLHQNQLLEDKQVDFSHGVKGVGRFRFNVFFQRSTLRVVARHIPFHLPDFQSLNLPKTLQKLMSKNHGLILITGATGNGKSSTIVAMLNYVNKNFSRHIITIEDPIEFLIQDRKSLITQRELGTDYMNYEMALKSSLRQDPDIIFFGELRDSVSTEIALNAANTGHLVVSTLHTNNASETVIRLLGMFHKEKQKHIRQEFASCLKAIICQRLVLRKDRSGFYPVLEILVNNSRVKSILSDEQKNPASLNKVIESSKDVWGMQSFNQHLKDLYSEGLITKETAMKASDSPEDLHLFFHGLGHHKDSEQSLTDRDFSGLQEGGEFQSFSSSENLALEGEHTSMQKLRITSRSQDPLSAVPTRKDRSLRRKYKFAKGS